MPMTMPRFDATWNFGHVLIAIGMIIGGVTGGLTVYGGVIGQMTRLTLDVETLKQVTAGFPSTREQQINNTANIVQLREITAAIRVSNEKIVDQLGGIRVDLARLQGQLTKDDPKPGSGQ